MLIHTGTAVEIDWLKVMSPLRKQDVNILHQNVYTGVSQWVNLLYEIWSKSDRNWRRYSTNLSYYVIIPIFRFKNQ